MLASIITWLVSTLGERQLLNKAITSVQRSNTLTHVCGTNVCSGCIFQHRGTYSDFKNLIPNLVEILKSSEIYHLLGIIETDADRAIASNPLLPVPKGEVYG